MNLTEFDAFMIQDTIQELWHKEHPEQLSERYKSLTYTIINKEKVFFFDFTDEMLIEDIMIIKESRYTKLYPHYHKYMELNYVYKGECVFTINNKEVRLVAGDICLLQPNVIHSAVSKGQQDIVLNIAFSDNFSASEIFAAMNAQQEMSQFLQAYFDKTRQQDEFLVFKQMRNTLLEDTLLTIFYMYFTERALNYHSMIRAYLKLMFMHLANATIDQVTSQFKEENDAIIFKVLKYITGNYRYCSLQTIAEELGYNYSYLSNLIKEKTGKTFTIIKLEQQMEVAKNLIQHSKLPIYKVSEYCGFHNLSFFYKRFDDMYHCSPMDLRKQGERNGITQDL